MRKRCTICRVEKSISEFSKAGITPAGTQRYRARCRKCIASLDSVKYTQQKIEGRKPRDGRPKASQIKAWNYLLTHPCVDCGETDIRALEFDHVTGDKLGAISVLIATNVRWEVVELEIAKCEIRCSNCHAIVTAERGNWAINKYLKSLGS